MPKVLQIRDVPDEVHDALTQAARVRGVSLTRYMLDELEQLAMRAQVVRENSAIVRRTQAQIRTPTERELILGVLRDGRGE